MKFKKIMAGIMVGAMMMSTVAVNANPLPTNLNGTGAVVAPTFAVLLPTAPVITVNPMQLGGTEQITSPIQVVANRSNVPVAINVRIGHNRAALPANQAILVETADAVIPSGNDATIRNAFLQVQWLQLESLPGENFLGNTTAANLAAHGILWREPAHTPSGGTLTNPARQVVPNTPIDGNPRTATAPSTLTGGVQAVIFLDQQELINPPNATFGANLTAPMTLNQVAAFRFGGVVNPSATWAAGQLAARVVFDITGVNGGVSNANRNNIRANNSGVVDGSTGSADRRLGNLDGVAGTATNRMWNVFVAGDAVEGNNFNVNLNQPPTT